MRLEPLDRPVENPHQSAGGKKKLRKRKDRKRSSLHKEKLSSPEQIRLFTGEQENAANLENDSSNDDEGVGSSVASSYREPIRK